MRQRPSVVFVLVILWAYVAAEEEPTLPHFHLVTTDDALGAMLTEHAVILAELSTEQTHRPDFLTSVGRVLRHMAPVVRVDIADEAVVASLVDRYPELHRSATHEAQFALFRKDGTVDLYKQEGEIRPDSLTFTVLETLKELADWDNAKESLTWITSEEEQEAVRFMSHPGGVVVAFSAWTNGRPSPELQAFARIATERRQPARMGVVTSTKVAESLGVTTDPTFVHMVHNELEVYTGEMSGTAIQRWVDDALFVPVEELGTDTFQRLIDRGKLFVLVVLEQDVSSSVSRDLLAASQEAARSLRDRIEFYSVHRSGKDIDAKVPNVVVLHPITQYEYHFDNTEEAMGDAEALRDFVERALAGMVPRSIRSAPPPENNDGAVKIVVSSTFDEMVMHGDTDVLLELYAPWCPHCHALEETYETLAETLLPNAETLVVAKMDIDANEIDPRLPVEGVPTILLFPAAEKSQGTVTVFEGNREYEEILAFVRKYATHPVKLFAKREEDTNDPEKLEHEQRIHEKFVQIQASITHCLFETE